MITGRPNFQHGFVHIEPIASNPEISAQGFRDVTMLSFWGAIVIEANTTGFGMEFIGNIYRSEILLLQSVHLETPGKEISRHTFNQIWNDANALLTIGVKQNAIITVDEAQPSKKRYKERVNIFAKKQCPSCKSEIRRFDIRGRRAFVCDTCQRI